MRTRALTTNFYYGDAQAAHLRDIEASIDVQYIAVHRGEHLCPVHRCHGVSDRAHTDGYLLGMVGPDGGDILDISNGWIRSTIPQTITSSDKLGFPLECCVSSYAGRQYPLLERRRPSFQPQPTCLGSCTCSVLHKRGVTNHSADRHVSGWLPSGARRTTASISRTITYYCCGYMKVCEFVLLSRVWAMTVYAATHIPSLTCTSCIPDISLKCHLRLTPQPPCLNLSHTLREG